MGSTSVCWLGHASSIPLSRRRGGSAEAAAGPCLMRIPGAAPPAASISENARLVGLDENPVRALVEGPLAAAVSDVAESTYREDVLNERIADLDWLAQRAAAHQDVNARLLELADAVIPLAFGALYRDDERVCEMLREDASGRVARLGDLAGRGEWLVTVLRDEEPALVDDDAVNELDAQIGTSTPGRAFLLEKRRADVAARAALRADEEIADAALARLEPVAERAYPEPLARSGEAVIVLRVSLLARRDAAPRLDAEISGLAADLESRGYRVRATGPWPAYRFGALP